MSPGPSGSVLLTRIKGNPPKGGVKNCDVQFTKKWNISFFQHNIIRSKKKWENICARVIHSLHGQPFFVGRLLKPRRP